MRSEIREKERDTEREREGHRERQRERETYHPPLLTLGSLVVEDANKLEQLIETHENRSMGTWLKSITISILRHGLV